MTCSHCGAEVSDDVQVCPSCGMALVGAGKSSPGASPRRTPPRLQSQRPEGHDHKNNKPLLVSAVCIVLALICAVLLYLLLFRDKDKEEDPDEDADEEVVEKAVESSPETELPREKLVEAAPDSALAVADYSYVCDRWLTDSDLQGMAKEELRLMHNTVYARHGRKFMSDDLREYFSLFSWYEPRYDDISANELSEMERHNVTLIQGYE